MRRIQKYQKQVLITLASAAVLWAGPAAVLAADPNCSKTNPTNANLNQCLKVNPIVKDLNDIVNVLSGLVGVVVVGVIILGGVQYAMAGDKAEAVSAAKKRIINGLIALAAFMLTYAFLQWLIPGGVFG